MTQRLGMCTCVRDSATQEEFQNFTRPRNQWFAQHLSQMLVNPPLTEACTASQPLTHLELDSHSHTRCFLMDVVVHVCGSRLGGQDRIGHGD